MRELLELFLGLLCENAVRSRGLLERAYPEEPFEAALGDSRRDDCSEQIEEGHC